MKIGCCGYSFNRHLRSGEMNLEEFIDLCSDLGIDGVELTAYYFPTTDPDYLRSVKRRCFLKGLAISGTAVGNRFTEPDPEQRKLQITMVNHWIECSDILGAPELRVFAGLLPEGHSEEEAIRWTVESLNECASVAAGHGVMLTLENHMGITSTATQVSRIMEMVNSDWVGLNLDTGNFDILELKNPYDELAQLIPLAVTSQFKNVLRKGPGRTPIDLERVIGLLHKSGYQGYLNIEYEGDEDPKTAVPNMVKEMRAILQAIGVRK